jgi:hypothetical protein
MTVQTEAISPHPTAEQVAEHLDRYAPRRPAWWITLLPITLLISAMVISSALPGMLGASLPWLALGLMLAWLTFKGRAARRLEKSAMSLQESAMLRNFSKALRDSWRLLPRMSVNPVMHLRAVTVIAHCLDYLKAYDAAIVGYDYLLAHLPPEHPGALQAKAQRAIASLCAHRLVDADDTLRQLRGQVDALANTPIGATYRLAQLVQHVRTGHFADAIVGADDLCAQLRPLGVDAGYGHALMALCFFHIRDDDSQAHETQASNWWRSARMLLPPAVMLDRFPELTVLEEIT